MAEDRDNRVGIIAILIAGAALVVCSLSLYVNLLHERDHEGANYMPVVLSILLFLFSVSLLVWAVYRNLKDASRAKGLEAQIVTLKDDHKLQLMSAEYNDKVKFFSKLVIHSAVYGNPSGERSVIETLRGIREHGLVISVDNNTLKCDPAPSIPPKKTLTVRYSYGNDTIREASREEGGLLVLPEGSEGQRLHKEMETPTDPCIGLFTPLQVKAFRLAHDIRLFCLNHESIPPRITLNEPESIRLQRLRDRTGWREKYLSAYKLDFEDRESRLKLEFGKEGIQFPDIDNSGVERVIAERPNVWVSMAHRLDKPLWKEQ